MVKAKVFILKKAFEGFPKRSDLNLVEEELPPLKDGEFLAEAVYLSVDPYMRLYDVPEGTVFIGYQVAKIIESKNSKYYVGQYVVGDFGWRSHTISKGDKKVRHLLDFQGLPLSLGVGILGMPGNTAYMAFLDICKPKKGETVVITGAAGAVGNHVGQIAKILGCTAIGITGSDEKGKWLTEELGFDHYINYKTQNVEEELKKIAPQGVDSYFDNVGGELSSIILRQMNESGKVCVCGTISIYNDKSEKASNVQLPILFKQLKMEGFLIWKWMDTPRWDEAILQNIRWIKEGKLKYKETVYEGFENMFEAFTDMLRGGNVGKAVVKV